MSRNGQVGAVRLQLDRAAREDRLLPIPVVLQRHVVHDLRAVEEHRHLVADHPDAEGVPLAHRVVGEHERLARVLLVVVEAAGPDLRPDVCARRVPDLDLRRAAQVDAAVAVLGDAPVDEHLEVAVVLHRAEVVALAVEDDHPVAHAPVVARLRVGLRLLGRQLLRRQLRPRDRVLDQALPAGQVLPVEDRDEPLVLRHGLQVGADVLLVVVALARPSGPAAPC